MAKRKPLTDQETATAKRLSSIWNEQKKSLGIKSQEQLAHLMDWTTQGAVNQYLLGKIPLNIETGIKFAQVLQVPIDRINPEWAETIRSVQSSSEPSGISEHSASYQLRKH